MSTETTPIEWSDVRKTQASLNANQSPNQSLNARVERVIVVPRAEFARTFHGGDWMHFADLEAAAASGQFGLEPLIVTVMDLPVPDHAFIRGGDRTDGSLRGRSCLFRQGW